jgi:hypothetical protein
VSRLFWVLRVAAAGALVVGVSSAFAGGINSPPGKFASIAVAHPPVSGQPLLVTVRVRNATTCTFLSQRGTATSANIVTQTALVTTPDGHKKAERVQRLTTPLDVVKTVRCAAGTASVLAPPVMNLSGISVLLTYSVRAQGKGKAARDSITVLEDPYDGSSPTTTASP